MFISAHQRKEQEDVNGKLEWNLFILNKMILFPLHLCQTISQIYSERFFPLITGSNLPSTHLTRCAHHLHVCHLLLSRCLPLLFSFLPSVSDAVTTIVIAWRRFCVCTCVNVCWPWPLQKKSCLSSLIGVSRQQHWSMDCKVLLNLSWYLLAVKLKLNNSTVNNETPNSNGVFECITHACVVCVFLITPTVMNITSRLYSWA